MTQRIGAKSVRGRYRSCRSEVSKNPNPLAVMRSSYVLSLGCLALLWGGSFVLLVPWLCFCKGPLLAGSNVSTFAAVAGLALASTAGGFLLYFRILRCHGAVRASWISFLVPVSATLLAAATLGQMPEPRTLIAAAVVLSSLALLKRDGDGLASSSGMRREAVGTETTSGA